MKSISLSECLKSSGKYFFLLLLCVCSDFAIQAQQINDATVPIDRNTSSYQFSRFQKQVSWINTVARNEKPFPIDLIFIGDSITHRWEKQGKTGHREKGRKVKYQVYYYHQDQIPWPPAVLPQVHDSRTA